MDSALLVSDDHLKQPFLKVGDIRNFMWILLRDDYYSLNLISPYLSPIKLIKIETLSTDDEAILKSFDAILKNLNR